MGYILTLLASISEAVIVSVGVHLTTTISGIFFLGIPAMIAIGAYGVSIPQSLGYGISLSLLFALSISICASFVFAFFYTKLSTDSFTVFSLTSLLAVEAVIKSWDSVTGGVLGISGIERPEILSSFQDFVSFEIILMLFVLLFEYVLLKIWFGRVMQGMKESPEVISSLKNSVSNIGMIVIVIASLLAALEGMLLAWRIQFIDASIGSILILVQLLVIAIIALKPKVYWLFFSVLFVVLFPEILRYIEIPSRIMGYVQEFLYSFALIVILFTVSKKYLHKKRFI